MRLFLKKRTKGQIEFGILYGSIAIFALCVSRFIPDLNLIPSCVFKNCTGLPCPTCGSSRAIVHLAHGDILSSIAMNPLTALCLAAAVSYFLFSLTTLVFDTRRMSLKLEENEKSVVRAGEVLLILVNWAYLVFTS